MVSVITVAEAFSQGTWSYGNRMPTGRGGPAGVVGMDGIIYVMGGNGIGDPSVKNALEAYDPRTDSWTIKTPMPTARVALAAALGTDGRIYTFGGCPENHGYGGVNTLEIYDPITDSWTTGAPMPTGRTGHDAVTGLDGRVYVFGGHAIPGGHIGNLEIYDPATNTWTTGAAMPTPRQQYGATLGPDGRIYVMGGSNQWRTGLMSVVEIYDPVTDTWTTGAPMPTARDGVGVSTGHDGKIYAIGGFSYKDGPFGDVTRRAEVYDPFANAWSELPLMPEPEYASAMVTGMDCRIYVIGGAAGYGVSAQVKIFEPLNRPKKCFR